MTDFTRLVAPPTIVRHFGGEQDPVAVPANLPAMIAKCGLYYSLWQVDNRGRCLRPSPLSKLGTGTDRVQLEGFVGASLKPR